MAPTRSWTALVLLSPLVASLPLPLQPAESEPEDYTNTHTNTNTNIHPSLEARSPDPVRLHLLPLYLRTKTNNVFHSA
ncbi:uncharacterized protein BDV14DRAFT_166288 [Aspergillus stella-maris]|uniref:uncharacterized protein n=1 Tax=Aspergillus stella-maris TaxID=1810926 RepID=UPI003CCE08C0